MLGDWAPLDVEAPGMDFAERLSLWVNAFDAIGLQAAHQTIGAIRTAAPVKPSARLEPVAQDLQRVRTALAHAIAQASVPPDAGHAAYRQRHLELQRQMEQAIGPLRDRVRQAIGAASPGLRKLAALDAVFEQVLAARGQAILPTVASVMGRRFEQLKRAHQQECEAAGQPDDPQLWHLAGGWLEVFARDWRQALLAELDLRLEPVLGLVEALGNELKNQA